MQRESWRAMDNVVVTGASRGIGLGIAKKLAASRYRVIAVARRDSAELNAAMREAEKDAAGALCFEPFDLGEIEAISGFVAALRKRHGPLYGLVNNAAASAENLLANMPNGDIEALLR